MDRRRCATRRFPENLAGENHPPFPRPCVSARRHAAQGGHFAHARGGMMTPMATIERHRLLSYLGPNWFASVMGTGIVATAGATLPLHFHGLWGLAPAVWVAPTVWLVILLAAAVAHWVRNPTVARSHAYN